MRYVSKLYSTADCADKCPKVRADILWSLFTIHTIVNVLFHK